MTDFRNRDSWHDFRPVGDEETKNTPPPSRLANLFYTLLAWFFVVGLAYVGLMLLWIKCFGRAIFFFRPGVGSWFGFGPILPLALIIGTYQWYKGVREERQTRRDLEIRRARARRREEERWQGLSAPPEDPNE